MISWNGEIIHLDNPVFGIIVPSGDGVWLRPSGHLGSGIAGSVLSGGCVLFLLANAWLISAWVLFFVSGRTK